MPSRPLSPTSNSSPSFINRTKVLFLILTVSSTIVLIFAVLYFLYHFWYSLLNRSRTIPFDATGPLKLRRYTYKQLKLATNDFDSANQIGKGGSGTVFKGVDENGKLFAIKRLEISSFQGEKEFQNELQILGGLRSQFLITLLGYCVEKNKRFLIYEYMPNKCLQEVLFSENGDSSLMSWGKRFEIILDVSKALEFLHFGCDPPVIHGDIKPSNVLLDSEFKAKISDFGLSRIKIENEFGVGVGVGVGLGLDMFSQDLGGKSQELSGNLETSNVTHEVNSALALQASSSSKTSKRDYNMKALDLSSTSYNANMTSEKENKGEINNGKGKGKEEACDGDDCDSKFSFPYDDELYSTTDHSKELNLSPNSVMDTNTKQWGKDWWWKQDGGGELCTKDYVREWIGCQICPTNPDWDDEIKNPSENIEPDKIEYTNDLPLNNIKLDTLEKEFAKKETTKRKKKNRKMQEWWKEEHLDEISKKGNNSKRLKSFVIKLRKCIKITNFDLHRRRFGKKHTKSDFDAKCEFSFRRNEIWSGDLYSRELSSTTSMRGTLCYVAPEYGGCGYLMEKGDIYSLGVLILVIVSGRRPLHVLASPMTLEKANLVSWCRHLAQSGNILELVDERLKDEYSKEQASLCINLALICLQKIPELRPDIREVIRVLQGETDLQSIPFEFSPSPPLKQYSKSRRKRNGNAE